MIVILDKSAGLYNFSNLRGNEMASTSLIPDTPAGCQVRWYLETLASAGRNTSAADFERFSASASIRTPFPGQGEDLIEGWRRASAAIGPFTPTAIEQNGDFSVTVMADGVNNARRFSFRCDVEERAPHLIKMLEYQRLLDVDVTVREASEADAAALSDLERRCPIVMGDTSMTIDRGADYFAFTRLMEEAIVSIALVGGKVAGVNCWVLPRHSYRRESLPNAYRAPLAHRSPVPEEGFVGSGQFPIPAETPRGGSQQRVYFC